MKRGWKGLIITAALGVCGWAVSKADMSPLASEYTQPNSAKPGKPSCDVAQEPTIVAIGERFIANFSTRPWAKRATPDQTKACEPE